MTDQFGYLNGTNHSFLHQLSETAGGGFIDQDTEHLIRIIQKRELVPHFQPIIDLFTGDIFGYELLTRSKNHFRNPTALFRKAEEAGLTWELEFACRTEALKKISTLPPEFKSKHFFINVNPHTFSTPEFSSGFSRWELDQLDIDYRNIVIEITESSTVDDYSLFEEQIRHYVGEGFHVALDDFGAGHSGLITLVAMTPHFLKLDMALIQNIHIHAYKQKLVHAISTFSSGVETYMIAEGIEKYEELKTVFRLGARYAQGFLFSRPEPMPPVLTLDDRRMLHSLIDEYNHTRFAVDISISKMVTRPPTVEHETKTCAELDKEFRQNNAMDHVVVLAGKRPYGLITRQGFYSATGGKYGYAFFERKYIENLKLPEMLVVDEKKDLRVLGKLAMNRKHDELYNPVVIVDDNGRFIGTITIKQLLSKMFDTEIKLASFANPLTQLPGNVIIGMWMEEVLRKPTFMMIYADLSYFKEFNDCFGFALGDDIIKMTARIIQDTITPLPHDIRFGHIGGDDFIISSEHQIAEECLQKICNEFDSQKLDFFSKEQQRNGYYHAMDRQGKPSKAPLVSLSLAVVTHENFDITPHPGKLSEIAAALKKKIKLLNANSPKSDYLIDRRTYVNS